MQLIDLCNLSIYAISSIYATYRFMQFLRFMQLIDLCNFFDLYNLSIYTTYRFMQFLDLYNLNKSKND